MSIIIKIKSGPQSGLYAHFDKGEISIGRDPSCDLVLDDIEVSRHHARIIKLNDDYFIEDLNSTNGTYINGKGVKKQTVINGGDLITLGELVVLEFILDEPEIYSIAPAFDREDGNLYSEEVPFSESMSEIQSAKSSLASKEFSQSSDRLLNRIPSWLIILVFAMAFLVIFCFIPFIIIEVSNQWCNLFSGFFNALSPGVCP